MMRRVATIALLAAIAGCSDAAPAVNESGNVAGSRRPPADAVVAPAPSATPSAMAAVAAAIPTALRGRWGLSQEDCDPSREDSQGMLVVGADELRFYASQGKLGRVTESSATRIAAEFAFVGEEDWRERLTLSLRDDKLVRVTQSPVETYTYIRCAA